MHERRQLDGLRRHRSCWQGVGTWPRPGTKLLARPAPSLLWVCSCLEGELPRGGGLLGVAGRRRHLSFNCTAGAAAMLLEVLHLALQPGISVLALLQLCRQLVKLALQPGIGVLALPQLCHQLIPVLPHVRQLRPQPRHFRPQASRLRL